jgi:hypothetical protein
LTDSGAAAPQKVAAKVEQPVEGAPEPSEESAPQTEPEPAPSGPEPKSGVTPAAAPSIRKLARDLGIDRLSWRTSGPTSSGCSAWRGSRPAHRPAYPRPRKSILAVGVRCRKSQ